MRIEHLFRYPVKGLGGETLNRVFVPKGEVFPYDRAFALAQGDAPFDPAAPTWLKKTHFMCLMANARIAKLSARFDDNHRIVTVTAPDGSTIAHTVGSASGLDRIGSWLTKFLGDEARGVPVFHHVPGHSFSDQSRKVVSLINLASLAALEDHVGAPRDLRRFRANVYFSGAPAWAEHEWMGRQLTLGTARLRIFRRCRRCPATEVNPGTAARDADPVAELRAGFGDSDLGVHAVVVADGDIAIGDEMELLAD